MRVLLCTQRLPYAANRGDRVRALNILRLLARHADVDLLSFVHDRDEEARAGDLDGLAASVTTIRLSRWRGYAASLLALPTRKPFTHAILDAPGLGEAIRRIVDAHPPDVVLPYGSGMARLALASPLTAWPFVLDMVDVDSEKWRALAGASRPPMRWIYASEARRLAAFETVASMRAHAVTVVNDRECDAVRRLAPNANVHVVPVGVNLDELRPPGPPTPEPHVVFCGVMNYPPNEDAALWLAREVWPAVRLRIPEARLSLVGAYPTRAVRRLATVDALIEVTGTVPDVRPWLWQSSVGVAPLRIARGVQTKVLEALAAGLPCVVTSAVFDGLPREVLPACRRADAADAFAAAILELLAMPADGRRDVAAQAELQRLAWADRLAPLLPLVEAASQSAKRATPSENGVAGS